MFIMVLHDSYAIIWITALVRRMRCRMLDPSPFRGVPHFQFGKHGSISPTFQRGVMEMLTALL